MTNNKPNFIIIGPTRLNLDQVTFYGPARIDSDSYDSPDIEYGVYIYFTSGKSVTLECTTDEECQLIISKLDRHCTAHRIYTSEKESHD